MDTVNGRPIGDLERETQFSLAITGPASHDLFEVFGIVEVVEIWGEVITDIDIDTTGAALQLFPDGGPAVPITALAGTDISSLKEGSFVGKIAGAGTAIAARDSLGSNVAEAAAGRAFSFKAIQGDGLETFIQLITGGTGNSGRILWRIRWIPISSTGRIVPA